MNGVNDVVVIDHSTLPAPQGAPIVEQPEMPELPKDWPARARMQPDGSVNLTLAYPVIFKLRDAAGKLSEGDSYRELTLRRLKGKHKIRLMKASAETFEVELLSCTTGLDAGKTQLLHGEMDAADIAAALRVANFFMKPGQKTGL